MKKFCLLIFLLSAFHFTQAQYPLVSIHDIEFVSAQDLSLGIDTSVYYGDTVQVEGIVTFDPCDYGLSQSGSRVGTWLEDPSGGAWSGVHVLIDAAAIGYSGTLEDLNNDVQFIDNFQPGNKVKCTGIVSSFGINGSTPVPGNTQILLLPIQSSITGLGSIPAPSVVTIDQFQLNDGGGGQIIQYSTGEQWEGVYVEIDNVTVTDVSLGSGSNTGRTFWTIQDQAGNKMQIRDVSGWIRNDTSDNFCTPSGSNTPWQFDISPYTGATISFLRGHIIEYCSTNTGCEYHISPRDTNDIGVVTAAPPIISNVQLSNAVPTTSQSQTVSATVTDIDGIVISASLYYSVGLGNQTYTSVAMTQSGNTWSATIPAVGIDSSYVNYWIRAYDDEVNFSNFPDTLATNSFYWVINSGINSIKDVQYNPTGNATPFLAGKWIYNMSVEGIVMATTGFFDLGLTTIQDGEGAWHGIYLRGQNLSSLQRGDKIKITSGKVFENFNVTFFDSTTYLVLSNGNPLYAPWLAVDEDSIHDGVFNETEPYEGLLIGFNNMFVVNQNPDDPSAFGEWAIDDNTIDNVGMRCDDYSNDIGIDFASDSLALNQSLDYIYGVLYYSFGNWKMLPRNKDDIAGYNTLTGIESDPLNPVDVNCYPNPVNGALNLHLQLNQYASLNIRILSSDGEIMTESNEDFVAGKHDLLISAKTWSSGMYVLQITGGNLHYTGKIAVVK